MRSALIADTGGLLRALACRPDGVPQWPEFADALTQASAVIVPVLVLAEVDYFLRDKRAVMRRLVAEILDPTTTYELEALDPLDIVRAMQIDAKFSELGLGLVDATIAAIAERRRVYRVLTIDRSDLGPLRVGERHQRALTLVP